MSKNLRDHAVGAVRIGPLGVVLAGLLLLLVASSARADDLNFTVTDGTNTMTWTLPSSPTPASSSPISFTISGITVLENWSPTTANITFYNQSLNDGGVSACNSSPTCADLGLLNFYDFQAFSGSTAAPTFIPGTYTEPATEDDSGFIPDCTSPEQDNGCGVGDTWALSTSNDVSLTLTIASTSNVPEPSSLLLLGTALLGLALLARFGGRG